MPPSTSLSDVFRAEFDGFLKEKANLLGIPTLSTANQIFQLFDEPGGGILHVTDLAAGLAVLCDGSLARSIRYACRLYRGPDGDMGFVDIYGFSLSIFKVRSFEPHNLLQSIIIDDSRGQLLARRPPAIIASQVAVVEVFGLLAGFNAMQRRKHEDPRRMFLVY